MRDGAVHESLSCDNVLQIQVLSGLQGPEKSILGVRVERPIIELTIANKGILESKPHAFFKRSTGDFLPQSDGLNGHYFVQWLTAARASSLRRCGTETPAETAASPVSSKTSRVYADGARLCAYHAQATSKGAAKAGNWKMSGHHN